MIRLKWREPTIFYFENGTFPFKIIFLVPMDISTTSISCSYRTAIHLRLDVFHKKK
jgi:hypothetical protein